jgi:LPXTG-site transpeptidase (sortase) family protein
MAEHYRQRKKFWLYIAIRTAANSMILLGVAFLVVLFWPFIKVEFQYRVDQVFGKEEAPPSGFRELLNKQNSLLPPLKVDPVNTDYGLVIEKINVNAPIIADVNPADPKAYVAALKQGAAHAAGTADPGDENKANNNVFVFAHSTLNIWDVPKYNAIFILLRELQPGDRVTTFYQGRRYDYEVFDKKVVEANDVKYLTEPSKEPILTLQTCDPPGTQLRRLIVTAKLVGGEGVSVN